MRALCTLPGGLAGFLPCRVWANHCRLRHIGLEKCGHGLTSRPKEISSGAFLNELLVLFSYLLNSAAALLEGLLPLRYDATRFASKGPTLGVFHPRVGWLISLLREVRRPALFMLLLVTGLVLVLMLIMELEVSGLEDPVVVGRESDKSEKLQLGTESSPRFWKRLRVCDQVGVWADAERSCVHRLSEGMHPVHDRMEVG